jgi:hypothetical protein
VTANIGSDRLRLWDVSTRSVLREIRATGGRVVSVAVRPDGTERLVESGLTRPCKTSSPRPAYVNLRQVFIVFS